MNRNHYYATALALALCSLAPSLARAQATTGELRDYDSFLRVRGEMGFTYFERRFMFSSDTADFGVAMPAVFVDGMFYDVDGVQLNVDFAWRAVGSAGDISAFRAGNPLFGVRAGYRSGSFRVRGGLAFTLPLTNLYDDLRSSGFGGGGGIHGQFSMVVGMLAQGGWDAWLLTYVNSTVLARGDFEYRGDYLVAGVDGSLGVMLPVEYEGRTGDSTYAAQIGGFIGGRPIPELVLGTRLHAVMLDSSADGTAPLGFAAITPFVRGEIGIGFIEGRVLVNLATDSISPGLFGENHHLWSAMITGGIDLESSVEEAPPDAPSDYTY